MLSYFAYLFLYCINVSKKSENGLQVKLGLLAYIGACVFTSLVSHVKVFFPQLKQQLLHKPTPTFSLFHKSIERIKLIFTFNRIFFSSTLPKVEKGFHCANRSTPGWRLRYCVITSASKLLAGARSELHMAQ